MHTIILSILFVSGVVLAKPALEIEIKDIENGVDDSWVDPVIRLFQ